MRELGPYDKLISDLDHIKYVICAVRNPVYCQEGQTSGECLCAVLNNAMDAAFRLRELDK